MPAMPPTHPSRDMLAAYGLGKLSETDLTAVAEHLEVCPECSQAVANLCPDSFIGRVRAAGPAVSCTQLPVTPPDASAVPAMAALPEAAVADVPPELADHPKFRILKELGRGGMGVVYKAEHRIMETTIALKVINNRLLNNTGALERFDREVRAAARLVHPHIVRALDADRAGELRLLVMELVEGASLFDVLKKKGPLPVPYACHYVRQASLGLQFAHEQGMVHRDIKPHNLMLTPRGQVKILDFGLARLVSERTQHGGLTRSGDFMGTPDFVAPEQATDASQADIRADLYSLGCTLYCLLTGHPPFQGASAVELVLAHIEREATPLHQVRSDVPAELSAVVSRLLAKDPVQRFQTPLEVVQVLAPFCKTSQKPGAQPLPAESREVPSSNRTVLPGGADRGKALSQSAVKPVCREEAAAVPEEKESPFANLASDPALAPTKRNEVRETSRPMPGTWWQRPSVSALVGTAILVLTVATGLLVGGIFNVVTDKGTLVVEINDPDVESRIRNGLLIISRPDGKERYTLTPSDRNKLLEAGPYKIRVQGADGLDLDTPEFTIRKGRQVTVRVTLKRTEEVKNDPPVKPAVPKTVPVGYEVLATGRWITVLPSLEEFNRLRNAKAYMGPQPKYESGVLEGNGGMMFFPPLQARDAIVRSRVKKLGRNNGNVNLSLRYANEEFVGAWFNGDGWFGLGRKRSGQWKDLTTCKLPESHDDFFEFAFAAVGNQLTAYANGRKIMEAYDVPAEAPGAIRVGGVGLFRDIEVQVLDRPAPPAAPRDFVPLFNGKDLTGWKNDYPGHPGTWGVENGILVGRGIPGRGHLLSDRTFLNFHLRFETMLPEGPNSNNAAIEFRRFDLKEAGIWQYNTLLGCADPTKARVVGDLRAGLKPLRSASNVPPLKPGEWFGQQIIAQGNHFLVLINGKTVVDCTDTENQFGAGKIVITCRPQCVVRFRKIEIMELTATSPGGPGSGLPR